MNAMKGRLWIAVDAQLDSRDVVARCIAYCNVTRAAAAGHLVLLWGHIASDASGGQISDKTDEQLEYWAAWTGEPGIFARFVREHCQLSDGTLKHWAEMQGPLEQSRTRNRERVKRHRERHSNADSNVTVTHESVTANITVPLSNPVTETETETVTEPSTLSAEMQKNAAAATASEVLAVRTQTALSPRDEFLAGVLSRKAWQARLTAWEQGGLHSLGATPAEIDKALEEYLLNRHPRDAPNARYIEAMIRAVVSDRDRAAAHPIFEGTRLNGRKTVGEQAYINTKKAMDNLGIPYDDEDASQ